jgi:hypothetical protein
MAQDKDLDSASSSLNQSKRPPLSRQHSEVSDAHQRPKQQKQHHVGRLHNRVPSSKALHKQHGHGHAQQSAVGNSRATNNNNNRDSVSSASARRVVSPNDLVIPQHRQSSTLQSHRRATSEVKLPQHETSASIKKSASQSSIKRNRSHGEIHKRTRSTDKLKRHSAGSTGHRSKSSKSQVHFDFGSDGQEEDEWVDASGSNSPHLSRKGTNNSSAQSSVRPAASASNSRPQTPIEQTPPQQSSPERERVHHREYLTTRLLQRTPSHGAPPQMTADIAQASQARISPDSSAQNTPPMLPSSGKDGLISRFVDTPGSGVNSEGSFYRPGTSNGHQEEEKEAVLKAKSTTNLSRSHDAPDVARIIDDREDSALVPKPARRIAGKPAETSRIQQKLNLQRASSAIEPGHNVPSAPGNMASSPLIGIGGTGFDGANGRDPRMGKLLERTGMEYLMVRRYQNPVARSLARLGRVPDIEKTRRIPRINTGSTNSKRSLDLAPRHSRNTSTSDSRRPITPRTAASIRAGGSSFEGEDDARIAERLSGTSLVGDEDDDGTAAILRSMWEKSMDLSASGD